MVKPTRDYRAMVGLGGRGKVVCRYVHRLVLEAFVGACPEGQQCRHLDGDTANNRLGNLQWGTPEENMADKDSHGTARRGCDSACATLDGDGVAAIFLLSAAGHDQQDVATLLGIQQTTVSAVLRGKTYRAEGEGLRRVYLALADILTVGQPPHRRAALRMLIEEGAVGLVAEGGEHG